MFINDNIFCWKKNKDNRGYFVEIYKKSEVNKQYDQFNIRQINESYSKKYTLRGLHFQYNPPLCKMFRLVQGHVILILLDRSPFHQESGQIKLIELKSDLTEFEDIKYQFIPNYMACGFLAVEDSIVQYLYDEEYNSYGEETINVFDPNLNWNNTDIKIKNHFDYITKTNKLLRSERDTKAITLKEWIEKEKV